MAGSILSLVDTLIQKSEFLTRILTGLLHIFMKRYKQKEMGEKKTSLHNLSETRVSEVTHSCRMLLCQTSAGCEGPRDCPAFTSHVCPALMAYHHVNEILRWERYLIFDVTIIDNSATSQFC